MQYILSGNGPIDDLPATAAVIARVLSKEGVDRISELSISFIGWRGDARCQIVDSEGWLRPVHISRVPLSKRVEEIEPKMPDGLTIRDRPDDLEWSPLGVMMGRDD